MPVIEPARQENILAKRKIVPVDMLDVRSELHEEQPAPVKKSIDPQKSYEELLTAKMKGLPLNFSTSNIYQFFYGELGLNILDCVMDNNKNGQATGVAYVQFATRDDFRVALAISGVPISGKRVTIDICKESITSIKKRNVPVDMPDVSDRSELYEFHEDQPAPVKKSVDPQKSYEELLTAKMKGLPINFSTSNVYQFFYDELGLTILDCVMDNNKNGQATGVSYVQFATRDDFRVALAISGLRIRGKRVTIDICKESITSIKKRNVVPVDMPDQDKK